MTLLKKFVLVLVITTVTEGILPLLHVVPVERRQRIVGDVVLAGIDVTPIAFVATQFPPLEEALMGEPTGVPPIL